MERKTSNEELEEIKYQVGVITEESLESTRRMFNMMAESEEAGRQTLETLDIQKQQLNGIEKGMDNINADMTEAQKSLKRLKQCCNICNVPWKKVASQEEIDLKDKTDNNWQIIVDQPKCIVEDPSSGYIKRITNDAREDEIEYNLSQVNSILGNLKHMAVDMNSSLSEQNEQIVRITDKGNINATRLDEVNTTANNLLNN